MLYLFIRPSSNICYLNNETGVLSYLLIGPDIYQSYAMNKRWWKLWQISSLACVFMNNCYLSYQRCSKLLNPLGCAWCYGGGHLASGRFWWCQIDNDQCLWFRGASRDRCPCVCAGNSIHFRHTTRVFLWKCQSFWDRKCLDLRGTRTPNLRIHDECSNLLSYQGQTFAVPCFEHWLWWYRYFWSKVNFWYVNCARAAAFFFDTRTGVLVKVSKFLRQKMSRPEGDSNPQPSDSCRML